MRGLRRLRTRLRYRRNTPVTDSGRALRDLRANVVFNLDATALAYALGPAEAQLASLQPLADRVARGGSRAER